MKYSRFFFLFLPGLTLLLAVLVLTDWLPGLRGPAPGTSEWYWLHQLRPFARWWLPGMVTAVTYLFAVWWLKQPQRRYLVVGLVGLVIANLSLQLSLVYAHRPSVAAELVDRTLANESNGYFTVAATASDITNFLKSFPQLMPTLPSEHTRTHPPGLIVTQWLTIRAGKVIAPLAEWIRPLRCTDLWLLEQPPATLAALGVWAFLPIIAAALTCLPLYFVGRQLVGEAVGRLAAILGATIPALLIFAPTPDQLYALLASLILLLWLLALQRYRPVYAFLAGFLLSLSTFLSLGNGVLLLILLLVTLAVRPSPLVSLGWLLLGSATVWLAYWLGWGVAPWQVAQVALQQHYELVTSQRRYDWWLAYNLLDLLIFAGPVLALGLVAAGLTAMRHLKSASQPLTAVLTVALGILIFALDISGSTRGEVGRLWLFFMPLLAVVVAAYLVTWSTAAWQLPLLLAAQLILALSLGLAWKPIEAIIVVAQRPAMPHLPVPTDELAVSFGQSIHLVGYDMTTTSLNPGDDLNFVLYWQGTADRPYTVFTHLLNQNGDLVAQQDNWSVNGQWPPTCWQADEIITDPYTISLPTDLAPGNYTLFVGLYDASDNTRLLTADGQDAFPLITDMVVAKEE